MQKQEGMPMNTASGSRKTHKKSYKTLRTLLLLILFLIVAIAASIGYSYKRANESLAVSFTDDALTVEVGGDYQAMSYIKDSTGEVTAEEASLEADTIGDKSIVFTVSHPLFGGLLTPEKEFTMNYTVIDSEAPVVLWSGDGTVLERGTEFDINNVVGYGDNADPSPTVEVKGDVDMNTNGSYPLHVKVIDASGNGTEWDLTVWVADTVPVYQDTSAGTPFKEFARSYAGDGKSFGIDVSEWQGDIDFNAVKAAGCEFVIIRIGYSVDGEINVDSTFEQNYKRAKDAGLKVGIYMYSYDNTTEKVRASADRIIEMLGGDSLDLPVAFDWEDFTRFQTYEMSFGDLNDMYDVFAEELLSGGYDCILYSSKNYLEEVWEDTDTRPVWLAHYTDKTDYKGPHTIWQAGSTGRIDGIDGAVDLDILYQ